jgi:23S rRNA (cytosine1962-C5)-methyltransferase
MARHDDQYELLDFGAGRKLERFGPVVVDRPAPAAESDQKAHPEFWRDATARFDGPRTGDGTWSPAPAKWLPNDWYFAHDDAPSFRLQLDALPSGQIGVFPEQRDNWQWITRQVERARQQLGRAPKLLNLFAYTGGSTLAAAAAGAEVVHVDAARNIVDRARTNAALSGLADRPIRWIVEDALKFCRREAKRGNRYDGVVLDPPSYGHGPQGEVWQIGQQLLLLLKLCGQLTDDSRALVLVTCHSPGIGPAELAAYLADGIFGHCGQPPATGELFLETTAGRRLLSGIFTRWPR